ncbi:MAG: PadR family transcriptional regulator [Thermotoga sp.]|nr:PadR family transcriptional regulator [Thermotogota bacterium]RKX56419.1 MAG: PadR family transcriptional regulator [Thermotoga sp.]
MKKMKCARFGFRTGNTLVAALLYLLLKKPAHGYSLVDELRDLGIDPAFVSYGVAYRLLRDMEVRGLISSKWEIEGSGPPRRIYSITNSGREYLKNWVNNAEKNLRVMNNLINKIKEVLK